MSISNVVKIYFRKSRFKLNFKNILDVGVLSVDNNNNGGICSPSCPTLKSFY